MGSQKHFFQLIALSVAIVRNQKTGKFLTIKETRNRGWWIPGGKVDPPEDIKDACIRECKEESNIDINLKGLLEIAYDQNIIENYLKMKFVFYAEPINPDQSPKDFSDQNSEGAKWVTLEEFQEITLKPPFMRGPDLLYYGNYIQNGGIIYPLNIINKKQFADPFLKK